MTVLVAALASVALLLLPYGLLEARYQLERWTPVFLFFVAAWWVSPKHSRPVNWLLDRASARAGHRGRASGLPTDGA